MADKYNNNIMSTGSRRSAKKNRKKSRRSSSKSYVKSTAERAGKKQTVSGNFNKVTEGNGRKKKISRQNIKKWSLKKKILMGILGFILFIFVLFCAYGAFVISTAPAINADNIYSHISQQSTLYDSDGKVIDNVFVSDGNRINVKYSDMPENMINAAVAIEDKTFWKHHGFNFIRIVGAVKNSITSGGQISGTSTITQQLARNVYLAKEKSKRTLTRKLTEAFYTMILEFKLDKKQIVEAYLNTIYLGYGSYGVQAASQAYFSKDVKDLDLIECASLAALPQLPGNYALIKSVDASTVNENDSNVLYIKDSTAYIYNGDATKQRRETCLREMYNQGYITKKQYKKALSQNLRKHIKINVKQLETKTSYFTDYVIEELTENIMKEKNYSYNDARDIIYTGGLKIYTTMNKKAQKIVESEFKNSYNFPSATNILTDENGNVLDKYGNIILYDYDDFIDSDENFNINYNDYKWKNDGSLVLYKGNKLNFYETTSDVGNDVSIEMKPMCLYIDGVFHTIESATLSVPAEYKTKDSNGNCIISADFFNDYPKFFTDNGESLVVNSKNYSIKQAVRQPQAAMVIIDNKTGGIAAMVGGRDTEGQMLYNRATSPRQPGSSIKPLSVYSSALQMGEDAAENGTPMSYVGTDTEYYGNYITAGSSINDEDFDGTGWPKNWYNGYKGWQTLRYSVEQSINVNAVRMLEEVDTDYAISQLKKFGITSVVEDGSANDRNAAALALGGMTKGISPLELASAYSTFPNKGIHKKSTSYTKVLTGNDEEFLKAEQNETEVLDAGVAFIMGDILRTTVSNGLGVNAAVYNTTACGKTGTTSDNYDMWFAGYTAQYSAALWWGNDVNIELTGTSDNTAALWGNIMNQITDATGDGSSLPDAPDNVITATVSGITEYFINGTVPSFIVSNDSSTKTNDEKQKEKEKRKKDQKVKKDDNNKDDDNEKEDNKNNTNTNDNDDKNDNENNKKPTEPAEPVEPVEPAEPGEPVEPAEP